MKKEVFGVFLSLLAITGCSSQMANIRTGNDLPNVNVTDLREAMRTVKVYPALPSEALNLGELSASRCHRNFLDDAPTNEAVLIDLKVSAYAQGADGLTQVSFTKESGLSSNCWQILKGTATAFSLPNSIKR